MCKNLLPKCIWQELTRVKFPDLTHKQKSRLLRLANDKHYFLPTASATKKNIMFFDIGNRDCIHTTFHFLLNLRVDPSVILN
jgi:ankyrin repeat protein